jgi:elongation factor P--(R)-beta-lysine ligase
VTGPQVNDFLPTAPLVHLQRRAELLRRLRDVFHRHGFWEVETPILSADTVIDRHLDPIVVEAPIGGTSQPHYFLQTSPEFGMKRLLAAGATAIFQVTRAFRRDELGPLHNPEFTMVEWYRVGDDMRAGMAFLSALADQLLGLGPADLCSFADAFKQYVGLDPHTAPTDVLQAAAQELGVMPPESLGTDDRDTWLHLLMAEAIQPHLGHSRPLILYDYPVTQAALARRRSDEPPVAERFELYCRGIEVANGYHELLDADELAARQRRENDGRRRDGNASLPEHNRLLDAMRAGLPACTGVAMGFDRLVMIALGADSLAQVIAFPFSRA